MTFAEAKATQSALDNEVTRLGDVLDTFPKGALGLTPDAVKFSPEYSAAKSAFDAGFAKLRNFNGAFTKSFAKEIREERRARRVG
jgi:hypothetical protein